MDNFNTNLAEFKHELGKQLEVIIGQLFINLKVASASINISQKVLRQMIDGSKLYNLEKYFEVFYKLGQPVEIISRVECFRMTKRDWEIGNYDCGYYNVANLESPFRFYKID